MEFKSREKAEVQKFSQNMDEINWKMIYISFNKIEFVLLGDDMDCKVTVHLMRHTGLLSVNLTTLLLGRLPKRLTRLPKRTSFRQ